MKEFLKTLGISIIIAIILFFVDLIFRFFSGFDVQLDIRLVKTFGYYVMYSIPITFVNAYFFNYINFKVKWKERYNLNRLLIGFFGSVSLTLLTVFAVRLLHRMVLDGLTFEKFIESESLTFYFSSIVITIIASLFFHAFYFYQEVQKNKVKEQKVIAGTASARFDALKNQLDPHFLFNSLNVLTSLIEENQDSAQDFTTSLSKVYRYVLEQKNKDLVTVDEELDFARTYMSLLKMRFEDSIVFDILDKASNPDSKVVPLSLQLLLENAVKHNMVTTSKPLHISIYEDGDQLIVANNLQPKQIVKKSSGVGLSNIKQRYNLLTDKKVNINQEANRFAVAIPMLTKQINIMRTQSQSQLDDAYVRAREYVDNLKGFYYNLVFYAIIIPFLAFINYTTSWHYQWFWWPMFGWGIGIVIHAYQTFVNDGVLGRSWERRKIQEFMKEEEEQTRWK